MESKVGIPADYDRPALAEDLRRRRAAAARRRNNSEETEEPCDWCVTGTRTVV